MDACLKFYNVRGLEISRAECRKGKEREERLLEEVQEEIGKLMYEVEKVKLLQKRAAWLLTPAPYNFFLLSAIMLGLQVRTFFF